MNPLFEAAGRLQNFCKHEGWHNCLIGGMAVLRWGEPRLTRDADLTLLTGFGNEETFIDRLMATFKPRYDNARDFALQYRTLLLQDQNGTPFDISLGALPFEARTITRSSDWKIESAFILRTCSAEDLIVHKSFANRDHDWNDIEGVLTRQNPNRLNWNQIESELADLAPLKENSQILEKLRALFFKEQ